jgi:purine-cytosine permease-like protein
MAHRSRFFIVMAVIALAAAATGFAGTYSAPPVVQLHGALLAAWLVLFLVQSLLVHRRVQRRSAPRRAH